MKLRAKQRKFIIFGFGILAALVLIYVLLAQQFNSKGTIDNLENKQEQYSRYLEIGKLEGPYLLELDEYKNRLQEDRTRFLEGDNPNVAKSELMKVLIDFAEKNGVEVTSRTPQNEEKIEDKLYKISARLQTRCNSEDLVRFLTDIRNYSKFLTIDELTIQVRSARGQNNAEMIPTLTVSGYISITGTETDAGGPRASL